VHPSRVLHGWHSGQQDDGWPKGSCEDNFHFFSIFDCCCLPELFSHFFFFSVFQIQIDKKTTIDVRCEVKSLSFSAHADAKGILQLIKQAEPKNVMLVHGEKGKM
jgi:hypothetical protein